ncbi:MAG: hypothetical protein FWC41_01850 [Firmicutes bacterium]|nr:hypothetical protein [Bacillota bacterium]
MNVNENNPILDAVAIRESVKKTTDDALKAIMEQQIKREMKRIIKEDDSDYEEEEVSPETDNPEVPEIENEEEVAIDDENEEIIVDDEMPEDEEEFEGMEEFEVDDDTYDVSQDDEAAIKVFKNMTDSDKIVITKQSDGTIELVDDETGTDYIIDLNEEEGEETLGECKFTNPPKNDDGGIKKDRKASLGTKKTKLPAPTGISKDKKVGGFGAGTGGIRGPIGDGDPFSKKVNENDEMNEEVEEVVDESLVRTHRSLRNVGKKSKNQISVPVDQGRVPAVRDGAQLKTEDTKYLIEKMRKMLEENLILKETVKQLKECAQNFYIATQETVLTNQKLGKAIQLFSEHSTTLEEKKNIIERFEGYKTAKEIQTLYETISKELKSRKPIIEDIDKSFNNVITEIKLTQQPSIVTEDVKKVLDLMKRVCK